MSILSHAQSIKHVVLISIDGLRPDFYLDDEWSAPTLKYLKSEGAYATRVKSTFPSYTYPSHTAMVTGALPARGGIYYNAPIGSTGDWNWFLKDIKSKTIWEVLQQNGITTSAVEWPVSVGEGITYNIPEIWSKEHPEDRISEIRKYATKGLIEEIELNATGRLDGKNMDEEHLSLDANAGRMASYIFSKYKPGFLALHFAGVDGAQHGFGRSGAEVVKAVANVDNAISLFIDDIKKSGLADSTAVLIIGDHGFMDIHQAVRPNIWLKQANLIGDTPDNWKAKFAAAGGSTFLYLKDRNDQKTLNQVKQLIERLPYNERKLFDVYDRKKLDEMGADSNAVLALAANPGVVFSGAYTSKDVVAPASGGHHGYDPNMKEMSTGFIAYGPGINKGVVISSMGVEDIAPTVAKLLNINFAVPDGNILSAIIKPTKK